MTITKQEYAGRDAAPVILYHKVDGDSKEAYPVIGTTLVIVTGGLVPRGEYAAGTDYAVGDLVSYNGSSYIMYVDAAAGTAPTDDTKWQVIASKGDAGTDGVLKLNQVPIETLDGIETVFTLPNSDIFVTGQIEVFLNGNQKIIDSEWEETGTTQITLLGSLASSPPTVDESISLNYIKAS